METKEDIVVYTLNRAQNNLRTSLIPEYMHGGIMRYLEHGIEPGSFLEAVFKNQLKESYRNADHNNRELLGHYVNFITNDLPMACQGSEDNYNEWIRMGGLRGTPGETI